MRILTLIVCFLCLSFGLSAANYYWVGGSGNWSDISHWATTSGGSVTHPQVPTVNDNVFFDENSFTGAGQAVTVTTDIIFFRNMDWTGVTNNPRFTGGRNVRMNVHGGIVLNAAMQYQFSGDIIFAGTSEGNVINMAGHRAAYNVLFEGSGQWSFTSGIQVDSIFRINAGTLNTEGHPITCEYFYILSNQPKIFSLGGSIITVTGEFILINQFTEELNIKNAVFNTVNLTLDAGNSTFRFTGSNVEVWKQGNFPLTLYNLEFVSPTGTSQFRIFEGTPDVQANDIRFNSNGQLNGNWVMNSLHLSQNKIYRLESGRTFRVNAIVAEGDCAESIILITTVNGSEAILQGNGNEIEVNFITLRDIHATNGSFTASNSTDLGNNNDWNFSDSEPIDYYWVGGSGNWTNPNRWSFTSGGPASGCVPTGKDNAIFDANSFNTNNQTVNVNIEDVYIGSMIWNGVTNQPNLAGSSLHSIHITRSLQLDPNMQHSFSGNYYFESSISGNTIQTAGLRLNRNAIFSGVGGEWTLTDNFHVLLQIEFISGHLNTSGYQVTTNRFLSLGTGSRHLNMENTHWLLEDVPSQFLWSQWYVDITNFTLDAIGSTVEISSSFHNSFRHEGNGNIEYHKVFSSGYLLSLSTTINSSDGLPRLFIDSLIYLNRGSIFGHTHFQYLELAPGADYSFGVNSTLIIERLMAQGTCEDGLIYMYSSTTDRVSNIQIMNDHILERLVIRNIRQDGSAMVTANQSIDQGGNENIEFNELESRSLYWVNGDGAWHDSQHWSSSSGGPGGECIPTSVDDVFFDENSFSASEERVYSFWNRERLCRHFTWLGTTGNPVIQDGHISIFGSMRLEEGMRYNISFTTFLSSFEETIFTAGRRVFVFYMRGSGRYTLLDDLVGSEIYHWNGDLIFEDIEADLSRFSIADRARYTELNGSRIHLSYNDPNRNAGTFAEFSSNHELNAGNSEIILTGLRPSILSFRGKTYNVIRTTHPQSTAYIVTSFQGGDPNAPRLSATKMFFSGNADLFGEMEMDSLIGSPGKTYQLQSDRTYFVNQYLRMIGNNCTPVQLQSTQPGSRTTISMPANSEIVVDFAQMRDVRGIGGAEFIAGSRSVNVNNSNENWIFEDPPEFIEVGFLGPDRALCVDEAVELNAYNFSPDENYLWSDGSSDSILIVSMSGEYHVTVTFGNNCVIVDTVNILDPSDAVIVLIPDTTICEGTTIVLDATLPVQGVRYIWNDGSTAPVREIGDAGEYTVEAEIDQCLLTATALIEVQESPDVDLGGDMVRCEGESISWNVFNEGAVYLWQDGSTESDFTVTESGIYWAEVTILDCVVRDSAEILFIETPTADLGPDISVCDTEDVVLMTAVLGGATYIWQDGSGGNTFQVTESGIYYVDVIVSNCTNSDTIEVFIQESPAIMLGEQINACEGDEVIIDAILEADAYAWSTGSNARQIAVTQNGIYAVTVTDRLCVLEDEVAVTFFEYFTVDLGPDQTLCEGDVVELDAGNEGEWQDGTVSQTYIVSETGAYEVVVSNQGCETTGMIFIEVVADPGLDLGDDVSACEGDVVELASNINADAFFWSTGSNNSSIEIASGGTFSLTVVSGPCLVEDFISVVFHPYPEVSLEELPEICQGEEVVLDAILQGTWQDGSMSSTYTATQEGLYVVQVNVEGCVTEASTFVTVHALPNVDLGGDVVVCDGDEVVLTVPSGLFEFIWDDGSVDEERVISMSGAYGIEAISEQGCVNSSSITVQFSNLPQIDLGNDVVVCEGDIFTIVPMASQGVITWGDGSTGPNFMVSTPGLVTAIIQHEGCENTASVRVTFRECSSFEVYAPNIFAPAGSGQNDIFIPVFPEGVEILTFSMKIFDRWGNKIFESRSLENPWDGTFGNVFSDSGVYVYILEVDYRDDREQGRQVITGDVMLVR